jgi:peptide deformylase
VKLRIYPDSILRRCAKPVEELNNNIHSLIEDMAELMYTHNGIGLAAPQVGLLQRIILIDNDSNIIPLINPIIVEEKGIDILEEGCLSLPGVYLNIERSNTIVVNYIDLKENQIQKEYTGLTARIIKHEIDHLNGLLIVDYSSTVEKYLINEYLKNKNLGNLEWSLKLQKKDY